MWKRRLATEKFKRAAENLVGLGRVELPTSPLSGVRSSHLSYRPGLPPKLPEAQVYKLEASGRELRANQNICLLVARSPELAARYIFEEKVERATGLSPV